MSSAQLYDAIGATYTVTRRTEPRIAEQIWAALGDAQTVLNVGAGTGSYEPPGRNVTAVEPSAVMRAQRPAGAAPCVAATAESLPFEDQSFDAAMASATIDHLQDRRSRPAPRQPPPGPRASRGSGVRFLQLHNRRGQVISSGGWWSLLNTFVESGLRRGSRMRWQRTLARGFENEHASGESIDPGGSRGWPGWPGDPVSSAAGRAATARTRGRRRGARVSEPGQGGVDGGLGDPAR